LATNALDVRETRLIRHKWAGCARKRVLLGANALDVREKVFYWSQMRWTRAKRRSIGHKCAGCARNAFY
jgi:hypothetical protein